MNNKDEKQASGSKAQFQSRSKPGNTLRNMTQLALPLGLIVASIVIVFNLDTMLK